MAAQPVAAPPWLIELVRIENKAKQRTKAWARAALDRECQIVAMASPGTRNDALNTAAFNLFQLVAGGRLDEQEVRERLFKAAEDCGLVRDDGAEAAKATIDSGAQAGLAFRAVGRAFHLHRGQHRQQVEQREEQREQHGSGSSSSTGATRWQQQQQARPTIRIIPSELPRVVDEAEDALLAGGGFELYQRAGRVVRPVLEKMKSSGGRVTFAWRLLEVTLPYMIETMTRAAEFEKWDGRARGFVPQNCPTQIAEDVS